MDEENTNKNPISEENSIPASPQSPMPDAPIPTMDSTPAEVPPEIPEVSPDDFIVKSNDIPPPDFTPTEAENEPKTEEKQAPNESNFEPIPEPVQTPETRTAQIPESEPLPVFISSKPSQKDLWKRFLDKVQIGKRKKLDKVMSLFLKHSKITNDEVEKFLHVSDATATRYLSQLEKEGKIKQSGKTGHSVFYSRI